MSEDLEKTKNCEYLNIVLKVIFWRLLQMYSLSTSTNLDNSKKQTQSYRWVPKAQGIDNVFSFVFGNEYTHKLHYQKLTMLSNKLLLNDHSLVM